MSDAGDALPLKHRDRAHQSAGTDEEHIPVFAGCYLRQDLRAEHKRAAPAPGAARVHILPVSVVYHEPAVGVIPSEIEPAFLRQRPHERDALRGEVPRRNEVKILRLLPALRKIPQYGVGCGGCKCQGETIKKL